MFPRPSRVVFAAIFAAMLSTGCSSVSLPFTSPISPESISCDGGTTLHHAQTALARARVAKVFGREEAIDLYYRAATLAWFAAENPSGGSIAEEPGANAIYRDAVKGLINHSN